MFLIRLHSDSVNGMGEFSEDFTNEEDLDARNKMFEEVKILTRMFLKVLINLYYLGMQFKPLNILNGHKLR